jgi:hypothetical protein
MYEYLPLSILHDFAGQMKLEKTMLQALPDGFDEFALKVAEWTGLDLIELHRPSQLPAPPPNFSSGGSESSVGSVIGSRPRSVTVTIKISISVGYNATFDMSTRIVINYS